ncbi:uncharacterized protein LOC127244260 [Andrographis paniculata]|uniref:uncharacterized protein LOC127244260 n=1 Tax=Andrographis paniculata TaxID=175694 RepID=UPI0021E819BF|nr:uncharacterized protein LOC127244260 [Andrographis paniculata]
MILHPLGWNCSCPQGIIPFGSPISIRNNDSNISNNGLKRRGRGEVNCGVEKDSEYEVDPEKAREALRQLDEQLQSLSKKQISSPKIRAVDIEEGKIIGDKVKGESEEEGVNVIEEIPDSLLWSVATGLILFTIFYNILFLTVIKPSIDGPPPPPQQLQEGFLDEP